jgi:hypothetical protein
MVGEDEYRKFTLKIFFQGLWMGYLTAAGSSARVAGPIAVSLIYKEYGTYPTIG